MLRVARPLMYSPVGEYSEWCLEHWKIPSFSRQRSIERWWGQESANAAIVPW